MTNRSRRLGLAVLVVALATTTASAAPYTWTTSGSGSVLTDGTGAWNTSALNWTTTGSGAAVAWPNLTTDVAVFGAGSGAAGTVTVAAVSTNGITFNQPGSGSYLLSGGTITLGGSSPTLTTATGVSAQIASRLAGSSAGLTTAGGGTLTLSGSSAVSGAATIGAGELILASGAALPSLNSSWTVGTADGTATLRVQSGASLTTTGAIVVSSSSRPMGAVIQEGGDVSSTSSLVLGNNPSASTTYSGSASYALQGGSLALTNTTAGFINIGRNTPATFTQSGGAVTLGRTSTVLTIGDYSTGSYEISGGSLTAASTAAGAILGNRGGAGTLTVSGSGSFGIGGSMSLAPNGSAVINLQGGTLAVNGMIRASTGGIAFNFSGGTLSPYSADTTIGSATAGNNFVIDLSGTGATFSGIDLAAAMPRLLTVSATLQGPGAITIAGGTVNLQRANTHSGMTTASQGTLALANVNALQNSTLNVGSLVSFTVAGTNTYNLGGLAGATNLDIGPNTLSVGGNNGTTTFSGTLTGAGRLTKIGTGQLTLSAANTYGGATAVNSGTLALGINDALSNSTAVTVAGGVLDISTFNNTVGSFVITSGSLFGSGTLAASSYTLGGGTVAATLGSGTATVTGNTTLSGTALATALNLNSGTLTVSNPNALTSGMAVSGSAGSGLTINANQTIGSLSGTAAVALGANTLTVTSTVGGVATNSIYAGVMSGNGGLGFNGDGSLTLSAANTHSGTTSAQAGTLALGNVNALQASTLNVGSLVTFTVAGANTYNLGGLAGGTNLDVGPNTLSIGGNNASTTYSGALSGSFGVGLTKVGTGTLTLSGSSTLSGALTIRGGEAILASGATLPSLSVWTVGATGDAATLRVQSGVLLSSTASGVLVGSDSRTAGAVIQEGGVVSIGNSSLVLSTNGGAGTYSGSASYVLQGGTLAITDATTGFINVGRNAPATFTQSGGVVTLGRTGGAALTLGDYSTGSYAISGGSLTAAGNGASLGFRGGSGTLTVSGSGSVGMGGSMSLASNGSATINLEGGTLAVNGMTRGSTGGSIAFNFSGGTLRPYSANTSIGSATAANNFAIDLSGTGATISGIDLATATPRTLELRASLQGTGDITVAGGRVNLRATNIHSGLTTIASGTAALIGSAANSSGFVVNGTLDLTSQTSGFTFGSAQIVSGAGTIALPTTGSGVVLAGYLAPGNSPGTLAFTGAGTLDLTQAIDTESSRLLFELDGIGASDLVTVSSGTLAIGSGLLEFSDFGFTPLAGFGQGTYTLFSAATITGSLGSSTTGSINGQSSSLQVSNNQIQLVVVPEPAGIALAGLGIVATGWAFRRRKEGRELFRRKNHSRPCLFAWLL